MFIQSTLIELNRKRRQSVQLFDDRLSLHSLLIPHMQESDHMSKMIVSSSSSNAADCWKDLMKRSRPKKLAKISNLSSFPAFSVRPSPLTSPKGGGPELGRMFAAVAAPSDLSSQKKHVAFVPDHASEPDDVDLGALVDMKKRLHAPFEVVYENQADRINRKFSASQEPIIKD